MIRQMNANSVYFTALYRIWNQSTSAFTSISISNALNAVLNAVDCLNVHILVKMSD